MIRRYDALRKAILDPNRERVTWIDGQAIASMTHTYNVLATTQSHFPWVWNVCIDAEKVGRMLRAVR